MYLFADVISSQVSKVIIAKGTSMSVSRARVRMEPRATTSKDRSGATAPPIPKDYFVR